MCAFGVYVSGACSGVAGFTYWAEVGDVIGPACVEGDDVVGVCGWGFVADDAGHGAVGKEFFACFVELGCCSACHVVSFLF